MAMKSYSGLANSGARWLFSQNGCHSALPPLDLISKQQLRVSRPALSCDMTRLLACAADGTIRFVPRVVRPWGRWFRCLPGG